MEEGGNFFRQGFPDRKNRSAGELHVPPGSLYRRWYGSCPLWGEDPCSDPCIHTVPVTMRRFRALLPAVLLCIMTLPDPLLAARKFSHFAKLAPKSAAARNFVALGDWLNDGVVLSGGVARECLLGWYGENLPARGRWQVSGNAVHPQRLEPPTLNIVPHRDRIVHPESSEPLPRWKPGVRRSAISV